MNYPPEIKIRKKIKFQAIFRIVIFLLLIAVSAGFLAYRTGFEFVQIQASENYSPVYGKLPENLDVADDDWETFRPAKNENQLNVLILGIRGEDDLKHGGLLTDTILIASVNKISGKTALISIPRDLFIRMPGYKKTYDKVNGAYALGLKRGYGAGLDYAKKVFSLISGVELDYAVVVDFKAFESVVDELGGIDVFLENEFSESKQWGGEFYLPAGANHLDGQTALYYARSRFSTSDFDRARRQKQIISAIKEKAASLGVLGNPFKIIGILSALNKNIHTDIGVWQINEFASLYSKVDASQISHKIFDTSPEGLLYSTYVNGAYILLPVGGNFDRIRGAVRATIADY